MRRSIPAFETLVDEMVETRHELANSTDIIEKYPEPKKDAKDRDHIQETRDLWQDSVWGVFHQRDKSI